MRRILTVLAVAALTAAMMVASALPAFADPGGDRGHRFDQNTTAGGSGGKGGGGGGITTELLGDFVVLETGGQGGPEAQRGGGKDCIVINGDFVFSCEHGNRGYL